MIRLFIIIACISLSADLCLAQNREPAFEMNERLGRGINMGNSFEAPTETEWGNQWKPEYFKIISELGFNHVRIPVRWETPERSMSTAPYTIDPDFMLRIQEVVDTALKYKLHAIINMHHHEALHENPAAQKERFLSQWNQIADHFKDHSDSLIFEVLNEPHGNLVPSIWNELFAEGLAEIRKTNPTRVVLMGVADYGGLGGIPKLVIPDDEYIILSPHYYNPFQFTHQGADWTEGSNQWLGTKWLDTEPDRKTVETEFNYAIYFSQEHHIPLHVGEFGAYSKADLASRARWTTFLSRWFEEHNISWAYWEFSAGFGIYNPTTKKLSSPLVDALVHNEMPEPTPTFSTDLYSSNFSSGADGWTLSAQGGAAANVSVVENKISVAITNGGSEAWHLQLIKNPIPLKKDKLYQLTFTAKATEQRNISFYAGKASDPWSAYSNTTPFLVTPQEATYSTSFTMGAATDLVARLVFDLGLNDADVTISSVKVEELALTEVVTGDADVRSTKTLVFPNPVVSSIEIQNADGYHSAELLDLSGRSHGVFDITNNKILLNDDVRAGIYILSLTGHKGRLIFKIVKM